MLCDADALFWLVRDGQTELARAGARPRAVALSKHMRRIPPEPKLKIELLLSRQHMSSPSPQGVDFHSKQIPRWPIAATLPQLKCPPQTRCCKKRIEHAVAFFPAHLRAAHRQGVNGGA